MVILSTSARHRRQRIRRIAGAIGKLALLLLLLVGVAYASYETGIAKNVESVRRMRSDLASVEAQKLELIAAKETAQERVRRMAGTLAELETNYQKNVPEGELAELLTLTRQRLNHGVSAERLRFLLETASHERNCDNASETSKLLVRTPTSTVLENNTVGFANNKIVINADGKILSNNEIGDSNIFDASQPIHIRFLSIDGEIEKKEGILPITHSIVVDNDEFQFNFVNDGNNGLVNITMRMCDYP